MSWALGPYGIHYYGDGSFPAAPLVREIGPFEFSAVARTVGKTIRVKYTAPEIADSPTWTRRLRILRTIGEWPQSWDDPRAKVCIDDVYPAVSNDYWFDETDVIEGVTYYYALFALRNDGAWICDRIDNRDSAYPYGQWGCGKYMYDSLPRGYRTSDVEVGLHLYQFMSSVGAGFDNWKTDVEHLLTLHRITDIHDDFIRFIDEKIGWPTWEATGGLHRRSDTESAVDYYKVTGILSAYEDLLESVSNWIVTVIQGWKYVMFSNGRFDSTTPDTTSATLLSNIGLITDELKYTPDTDGWHSVSGLGIFIEEDPGVSDVLTTEMVDRFLELIDLFKASYATEDLMLIPITPESIAHAMILDGYVDVIV